MKKKAIIITTFKPPLEKVVPNEGTEVAVPNEGIVK